MFPKKTTYIDIKGKKQGQIMRLLYDYTSNGYEILTIDSVEEDIANFGHFLCVNEEEKIIYFEANEKMY